MRARLDLRRRRPAQPLDRAPVEGAVGDQVHERREHGDREDDHLDEAERPELVGGSTAYGYRKMISMSKTMKIIATR